jgi:hypothetical protein
MIRKRSMLLSAALTAAAVFAPAASALATGFVDTATLTCNAPVNVAPAGFLNIVNHVFVSASDGPANDQLWIAYGRGTTAGSWHWFKATPYTVYAQQFACAAADAQGLVVFLDQNAMLRSRDRLSGWSDIVVPVPGVNSFRGAGKWAGTISDQGRKKIALFATKDDTTGLIMNVWDDASNPGNSNKWGTAVTLGLPPGNVKIASSAMSGFTYDLGAYPNTTPSISVFVIGQDGHLYENFGGLTGRGWRDVGTPSGATLTTAKGYGPTAIAYRATVGHPPPITEGDWYRRVTVPANDNNATVWAANKSGSASSFSWQALTGNTTNPVGARALVSGLIHSPGCAPGAPCPTAVRTVGVKTLSGQSLPFAENISVDLSSGSWNILSPTQDSITGQAALVKPDGATAYDMQADASLVYVKSSSSLRNFDTATGTELDIGHP